MDSGDSGEPAHRLQKLIGVINACHRHIDDGKENLMEAELKKAQQQYKNDPEAQVMLGQAYTEFEMEDEAIACFNKAIELEPKKEWVKFVYVAQLQSGADAVKNYERALKVLTLEHPEAVKTLPKKPDVERFINGNMEPFGENEKGVTQEDIRDIYLSLMDNYLTEDMWELPGSKPKCQEAAQYLLSLMPNDFETLQAVASYHLRCSDKAQASKYIEESISKWEPVYLKLKERCKDMEEADEYMDGAVMFDLIPSHDFRVTTLTILADVGKLDKAEEIGRNMLEVDKVEDFRLASAMAILYEKLENKTKQKEMLELAFFAGVIEELFEIESNSAGTADGEGDKDRSQIVAKYIEVGGTEEELKQKAEAKVEEHDNAGSDEDDYDEEEDDDDDDEDEEDDDDTEDGENMEE